LWRPLQTAAGVLGTTLARRPTSTEHSEEGNSSEPGHFAHCEASGAILEQSDAEPFRLTVLLSENKEDAALSLRF
jgi:hypothetical protein